MANQLCLVLQGHMQPLTQQQKAYTLMFTCGNPRGLALGQGVVTISGSNRYHDRR